MDDTVMQISAKHEYLREKLNRVIKGVETPVPEKHMDHFRNQLHQIKAKHYDLPPRSTGFNHQTAEDQIPVPSHQSRAVLDDLDDFTDPLENLHYQAPSLNYESGPIDTKETAYLNQIEDLKKQLLQRDEERADLIEEFQLKHTDLLQQLNLQQTKLNRQQKQIDEFPIRQKELMQQIQDLKQQNRQLIRTNQDYIEFKSKSINKIFQLKLQNSDKEESIEKLLNIKRYLQAELTKASKPVSPVKYNDFNTTKLILGIPQHMAINQEVTNQIEEDDTTALINGVLNYQKPKTRKSLKAYGLAIVFLIRIQQLRKVKQAIHMEMESLSMN